MSYESSMAGLARGRIGEVPSEAAPQTDEGRTKGIHHQRPAPSQGEEEHEPPGTCGSEACRRRPLRLSAEATRGLRPASTREAVDSIESNGADLSSIHPVVIT